jgi:hypothetical protein
MEFARKIQATFTQEAIESSIKLYQIKGDVFSKEKIDGSTPLHAACAPSKAILTSVQGLPMSATRAALPRPHNAGLRLGQSEPTHIRGRW